MEMTDTSHRNAAAVRKILEEQLRAELLGPEPVPEQWKTFHHDEILAPQDNPKQRYSAGVLFPRKAVAESADDADDETTLIATPADAPDPREAMHDVEDQDSFQNDFINRPPSEVEELGEHNPHEQEVNRANEFLPSAMGLSCLMQVPKRLLIKVSASYYVAKTVEGLGEPDRRTGKLQAHHFRHAIDDVVEIDGQLLLAEERVVLRPEEHSFLMVKTGQEVSRLAVHIFSRTVKGKTRHEQRMVTVTLLNLNECDGQERRAADGDCFFQCGFTVAAQDDIEFLCEYPDRSAAEASLSSGQEDSEEAAEERMLALLYRERRAFAIGHGCAATWKQPASEEVAWVKTDVLPRYEVFPLKFDAAKLRLPMSVLGDRNTSEALEMCELLASEYERWIEERVAEAAEAGFPSIHSKAAERQLTECRECLRRVRDGITVLRDYPDAMLAFRWMNVVMLKQQAHYKLATDSTKRRAMRYRQVEASEGQTGKRAPRRRSVFATAPEPERPVEWPDYSDPKAGQWRPFQLAFILMNLRGLVEPTNVERKIVDLIWFPTGGGKTEAYLGLTALTIFWRRLGNPMHGGTTVLMRYTLRLLTTQQFQRAASLICACELLRRDEPRLNHANAEPISIGLWVGNSVTPNTKAEACAALRQMSREGKPNPFVLLSCPWCGIQLGPVAKVGGGDYARQTFFEVPGYVRIGEDEDEGRKVIFRCPDAECPFSSDDGMPVHVVDEVIYEERPTLVIGTVDKFAMMPWKERAMKLFGLSSAGRVCPPPALVIQDELHLIAGALGSMVGHYELTIDALTTDERGSAAKIIASTATICRATDQVKKLYNRNVAIFPPQGLLAGNSFFAQENLAAHGRIYFGVMATAVGSHITAQVRTLASLLQTPPMLGRDGYAAEALDAYWTLMVYFNSLRELGHASTLIHADIQERLFYLFKRLGVVKPVADGQLDPRRFISRDEELTSRVPGDEVSETLSRLFAACSDDLNEKGKRKHDAIDVCLATNMIQVGLDVPRLGLMAVIGQPKTTSEYIQATSRVGRGAGPGFVVTIYNPAKPRDRSHYEHFASYHQSLYRWVEPTSVTPFALPVRERALHAQVVAMARYWGILYGQDSLRKDADRPPSGELLEAIEATILDRCRAVDADETEGVERRLKVILKKWRDHTPLRYGNFKMDGEGRLMYPMGATPRVEWEHSAFKTPTSMRSVDATSDATLLGQFSPDI